MRVLAAALVLSLAAGAPIVAADPVPPARRATVDAPPKRFAQLVAAVRKAGFHRNTSEKTWKAGSVCPGTSRAAAYVCDHPPATWVTSIVADDDRDVVQELWLFATASADEAARVKDSLEHDFDYGPFAKHPYRTYLDGASVVVVEGRFRWHTAGERLNAAVEAFLAGRAAGKRTK